MAASFYSLFGTQNLPSESASALFFFLDPYLPPFVRAHTLDWWLLLQVVGVVILLGPRVQGLVSTLLQVEAGKRSRFPPGLEPQRGARGGGVVAAGEGAGEPGAKEVLNVHLHVRSFVVLRTHATVEVSHVFAF